jgi:hypothetical protein
MRLGMEGADLRTRPGRTGRTVELGFDLMTSKLRHPEVRPGTIGRSSLLGRLAGDETRVVVSVAAPSGYGKTTLLAAVDPTRRPGRSLGIARRAGQ